MDERLTTAFDRVRHRVDWPLAHKTLCKVTIPPKQVRHPLPTSYDKDCDDCFARLL